MTNWTLLISPDEVDAPRLLSWWSYLAPDPGTPLALSPFGDWFLQMKTGEVCRLDLLEGSVEHLVLSASEFWKHLETDAGEDDWLQAAWVASLEESGVVRSRGQCYTYAVHPRLGGSVSLANVKLGDIGAWQLFCSQIHPQLDALSEGARWTGLDCSLEGRVTVLWEFIEGARRRTRGCT